MLELGHVWTDFAGQMDRFEGHEHKRGGSQNVRVRE